MTEAATAKPFVNRYVKLSLKIAVTLACFWYISKKIDLHAAGQAFTEAKWTWVIVAVLLLTLSKIFAAIRLNIYFRNINLVLSQGQNFRLYWLGMFYNLFLPGSISGDAYKVILLKRRMAAPYRKTSAAVLLDRLSGVIALSLIMACYSFAVSVPGALRITIVAGAIIVVPVFYWATGRYLRDFLPGFWQAFGWGIAVQGTQVVCVYALLAALHIPLNAVQWPFIFLVAAVVAVFPVSLGGGLGTRELIFVEGAKFYHLDPEKGLVISLLFYLVTVIASVWGAYYIFRDPLGPRENRGTKA